MRRWIKRYVAHRGSAILLVSVFFLLSALRGSAQNATFVMTAASANATDLNQPFLLSTVGTDVTEAISDYRRYCQRQQWEKAFKELEKVGSAKPTGLIPDKDGAMVPPSVMLARLLADLPDEGKSAFRLFHDADAKTLLEQAQGKDEEANLTKLATEYLFTSSGDVAADRLGDLLFERGEFGHAIGSWRSILNGRSDSTIARPQLLVKIAIAAARGGRWQEFQETFKEIQDKHADADVVVGGQNLKAVDCLKKYSESKANAGVANRGAGATGAAAGKVRLAADAKPLWQFRWFPQVNPALGDREGLVLYDQMYGRQFSSAFVPPVAIDGQRIFSDLVGYDVGIDLATGKLAWRSGRFFDLMKNDNQNRERNLLLEQSGVICTKDRVWSVAHDPSNPQNNGQPARYNLIARNVETGKEEFNNKSAKDGAREWTMNGDPVVDDERLYIGAYKTNQPSDVYALCLNLADGKLVWSTKIGTYKNDPRQNYYMATIRATVPSLVLTGGKLYFDTQAGSLVHLNAATGEIVWGINYDSDVAGTENYYDQAPEQCTVSRPMLVGGVLYFKGMRSRRLYAVDPAGPKVLWSRPVSEKAMLVGVDQDRVYLGGPEITAYDLKTRQLLWSKPVPMTTGYTKPLLTEDRIYQFSPRGIYELDKSSGEVVQLFRGADMDSVGGALVLAPHALVAVSNLAI
ncbi:MAG TPA: PQQ-binding-like beta-propeller repeat protein, partial [Pirellulales bacterium]